MKLTDKDAAAAYDLISQIIEPSPLVKNIRLSQKYDCNIFLKLENMLPVGSFKMRGALYKISNLTKEQKKKGVLAVSAGNHAQGVAWAAQRFKIPATIIMPKGSPLTKVQKTRSLGAKVILEGENVEESFAFAKEFNSEKQMNFIHPFEDKDIIAGQSTVATEILGQFDGKIDYLFGAIGGGGLMSGVGQIFKKHSPKTKIIGAQALGASSMVESLQKNKVIHHKTSSTFADGIKVKRTSRKMFNLLKKLIDFPYAIDDSQIAYAVLELMENAHIIAEGAGAIPLAAFDQLFKKYKKKLTGKNIVLVICGGNIDVNVLSKIIDKGLLHSGRRVRLSVEIDDRPGELARLTKYVSDSGANILQVLHDNDSPQVSLLETIVELTLETKGRDHQEQLIENLDKIYKDVKILD